MLTINTQRLLDDLHALSQIGRTPEGGVSRPALSEADLEARAWFRQRAEAARLAFRQDGAANVSAVLPAEDPAARTLLAGSHLDSVPDGGRYDGALGTLCALEALRAIKEAGLRLPLHLEAIAFTDEEGTLVGLLGSRALAGLLTADDLARPRGGQEALAAGMRRAGITPESILAARRPPESLAAFVEVHIEQGTRLEAQQAAIGVVTAIVGIRSFWLRFSGQAAHAGTTPLDRRADALWGAADFVGRARALVEERFSPGVVNCGQLVVRPGAFNIVPGEARLALEFRHSTDEQLDGMEAALLEAAQATAQAHGLELAVEAASHTTPTPLHEGVIRAIEGAADALRLPHTRLVSFAGHDTQAMSAVIPSAMFFVPSVGGISHSPREYTRDEDVINAGNVLLHTLLALAGTSDSR